MKKISLKNLNLKEVEQLSREQLKDVLGGWTGGSGTDEGTSVNVDCECESGRNCHVQRDHPNIEEACARCCAGEN